MNVEVYLRNIDNEYSVLPFWFWNDDISKEEISRQLDDFMTHGVYGFTIHPRVGLPRSLGWMSEKLLDFYDFAIEEAFHRNMKVVLYDEGMYPSGSSSGQVVSANPDFQVRCLDHKIFPANSKIQLPDDHNLIATKTLENGEIFATFDRKADGYIRGLHYLEEGRKAEDEPIAADILNPKSVQKFIELVYKVFAVRYQKYLGSTIVGIFTDEPRMLGRSRERNVLPGTKGILSEINRILGYDFTSYLPCLWQENSPEAKKKKAEYLEACEIRLQETYYTPISKFCQESGLKLVGHPDSSDDIGALRFFDTPGQDLVWRMVVPDSHTAIEGADSTTAKCSSSVMIHMKRERNLNELCGGYGHELTWDEMNWLSKWCFIRGVNMLLPHAFYYSVRGLRKEECPPDVGPNAPWWGQYKSYADACKTLSFINTNAKHVCQVAIIGKNNWLPWQSAKICFENQIDFNYLDENYLENDVLINKDGLHIAGMIYQTIIHEHDLSDSILSLLEPLKSRGQVLFYQENKNEDFISKLESQVLKPIVITPQEASVRIRVMVKNNFTFYMIFNESSTPVEFSVDLKTEQTITLFKPFENEYTTYKNQTEIKILGFEYLVFVV